MNITVVGSINLDMVATAPSLPAAGETVTGASLARHPGGKGANQALAAEKLGAKGLGIKQVALAPLTQGALCLDAPTPDTEDDEPGRPTEAVAARPDTDDARPVPQGLTPR